MNGTLKNATCEEPSLSIKFVQSGIKKYLKEKWDEAEEEFVKAVEANDISAKGWYYLGMCRVKQNDGDGAGVCFKKAIAAAKVQEPELLAGIGHAGNENGTIHRGHGLSQENSPDGIQG
jgi:tetratricopeptide (TPR) repeat protein